MERNGSVLTVTVVSSAGQKYTEALLLKLLICLRDGWGTLWKPLEEGRGMYNHGSKENRERTSLKNCSNCSSRSSLEKRWAIPRTSKSRARMAMKNEEESPCYSHAFPRAFSLAHSMHASHPLGQGASLYRPDSVRGGPGQPLRSGGGGRRSLEATGPTTTATGASSHAGLPSSSCKRGQP